MKLPRTAHIRSSGQSLLWPPTHTRTQVHKLFTHIPHMTYRRGMWIHTLGGNYTLHQTHLYSVGTNTGQMDRCTQIGTDRSPEGYSHTWREPVLRRPTDLASSWPLQRALKRLWDNLSLPLSVLPSLPPPPSFCPRFGLCPDKQSHWWLCFQLSQPLFLHLRITSSCSVGNIQESGADKPKEMFWETASIAKSYRGQPHTGPKSR